jgi:hypothetical protein
MGVGRQSLALPALPSGKTCTHCTGGWVGPRADLEECMKLRHHRDLIPRPFSS